MDTAASGVTGIGGSDDIEAVIVRMRMLAEELEAAADPRRFFHVVYLRTTVAVRDALAEGAFLDREWVERWDVAFARLYLDALEVARAGGQPSPPWRVAFDAAGARSDLPPLRHVLLGMNAHINADLPQALIAVIDERGFDEPVLLARRREDHGRVDAVLARRVAAEDAALAASGRRPLIDRVLAPANRAATTRFLREAREKVWANALVLDGARRHGEDTYAARRDELEELSADKVRELLAPGQVLLRLAVRGFGVRLAAVTAPGG